MIAPDPVIDVHAHGIPPQLVERLESGWSSKIGVRRLADGRRSFSFPNMAPSPPAPQSLLEFGGLSSWATEHGLTTQLVGPWTDLVGYTLPDREAEAWSQLYNETLVASCEPEGRLQPMATVPLQAPTAAVRVLEAARAMGARGVVIGTALPGTDLADPVLDDVWAAAAQHRMPILVHPTFLAVDAAYDRQGLKNAVGRASVSALALTRLVYAGVLDRHPDLVLIAAHGGGAFVPLIDRIAKNQELGWADSGADVSGAVRKLYWDSVVLDAAYLDYLVAKVGADRILLGSDRPFPWEPDPVGIVTRTRLKADEVRAIQGRTAARLLGLGEG